MVPGDGGEEEGGVKVILFRKKNLIGSKGDEMGTFMFAKKSSQRNMQISIKFTLKVLQ